MNYSLGNMLGGAGALNADKLSLDLQFAADKTLTARRGPTPTFTRASTARFVGSNGLIQSAAINAPRFDHDPVTLACKGLLIEESRTNLVLQSNAFSTSPWGNLNSACDVSQNQTGPDGVTNSAWTFTDDNITNIEGRYLTASLTSGVAYSFSVFVKKTTGTPTNYPAIWLARGGVFGGCVINTTAGTATPITAFWAATIISTTASVVDFGNFWRVTSFITPNATGSWEISISPSGNGTGTGVIDAATTGSAVFWGAQIEAGSFPTSYIPTTTASVVRSADLCSITGSDFTGFYNQSEGTIVGSGSTNQPILVSTTELFRASDGTNNNRIQVGMTNSPTEAVRPFIVASGTTTYSNKNGTATVGVERKVGTAYKTNDAISAFNGTLGTLDTTVTPPTNTNQAVLFSGFGSGTISSLRYFKKRLSDTKLQTLTTL